MNRFNHRQQMPMITCLLFFLCWGMLLPGYAQKKPASQDKGKYEGETRYGVIKHGQGKYVWPDGSIYVGKWRNDVMHGYGTLEFYDGSSYSGEWHNGFMEGEGTYKWPNGDTYTGGFRNGKKSGYGKLSKVNGEKHEGQWLGDMCNGQGTHTYPNGDRYIGDWKNNMRQGKGIMIYRNGDVEQGSWVKNEHVPCYCSKKVVTVEEAYQSSDAVFVGVVSKVTPMESYDVVEFEVTSYWKGKLFPERRIYLRAGTSSCDHVYFEGESFLVYAKMETESLYYTDKCTRTARLSKVVYDLKTLEEIVPCKSTANDKNLTYYKNSDPVCGCDGKTYENAYHAQKNGIQFWRAGKCNELNE
ncbi:hypothetical protein AAG747_25635 [Rapidithrix thailandica]|uniref:MORN repeat protein n=1 Tax=Rapidithrix thailandica TaxID=413964 RepID=A0AAW9SFH0_9BACT